MSHKITINVSVFLINNPNKHGILPLLFAALNLIFNDVPPRRRRPMFNRQSDRKRQIKNKEHKSFYVKSKKRKKQDSKDYKEVGEIVGPDSAFNEAQKKEGVIDKSATSKDLKQRFSSFDRHKEADNSASLKDFVLSNEKNILSGVSSAKKRPAQMRREIRAIPLQIKALLGSRYDFARNNIFFAGRDLLKDSLVRDLIMTSFMTLVKVQYLDGYTGNSGKHNLQAPMWKDMTSYTFSNLVVKNRATVLCRFVPFESDKLKVSTEVLDKMGIENKYFYVGPRSDITPSIPPRKSNSRDIQIDNVRDSFRDNFESQIAEMTPISMVSCKTLVIRQSSSKNGPLASVDYGIMNDLVSSESTQPMPTQETTTGTGTTAVSSTQAGSYSSSGGNIMPTGGNAGGGGGSY